MTTFEAAGHFTNQVERPRTLRSTSEAPSRIARVMMEASECAGCGRPMRSFSSVYCADCRAMCDELRDAMSTELGLGYRDE